MSKKPKKRSRSRRTFNISDDVRICQHAIACPDGEFDDTEAFVLGYSPKVFAKRKAELIACGAVRQAGIIRSAEVRFLVLSGHMPLDVAGDDYCVDMEDKT